MSGPEHYAEAERLLALADSPAGVALLLDGINAATQAQVHAILALVSATIDAAAHPGQSQVDYLGHWFEACS